MTQANLPFLLQNALLLVPAFLNSIRRSRPGLIRAMRQERYESLLILLPVLLMSVSLQHMGAICRINGAWVRPLTVDEMVELTGLSKACVNRCLAFLRECGFIYGSQIKRKNPATGRFEVSPGLRFFTQKFWDALGLKRKFESSIEWAKNHCKRKFLMPFKGITLKVKSTFSSAKDTLQTVLKNLDPTAQKIVTNCNKIREMVRQQK